MTPPQAPFDSLSAGQVHLRLLATTDLHAHMLPYDYYVDGPNPGVGLAGAGARIRALRREAANSLLFDNGDLLQGTPLGDHVAFEMELDPGQPHPIFAAMAPLGYDAGTLGNHEFNYGLGFLQGALAGAPYPVVLSNLATRLGATPLEDETLFPPYLLLRRNLTDGAGALHELVVGVVGLTPPQCLAWDRAHLAGRVALRGIKEAAAAWVPEARRAGADLVIALCHSGIAPDSDDPGAENAAIALAGVEGLDALILGHTHKVFPGPAHGPSAAVDPVAGRLHGKPAVMAGAFGSHVGCIDLHLEQGPSGWQVTASQSAACPAAETDDDAVAQAIAPAHAATLAAVRRSVGETAVPLHTYFAQLGYAPSLALIHRAQRAFVAKALADTEAAGLPILSAAPPFKAGGGPKEVGRYTDIAPGPLALRHMAEIYPYPNTLAALRLTGAALREWLEHVAGAFAQVPPGAADVPLLRPDFPSYDFDIVDGIDYQIDLSQPARYDISGALVAPEARRIRQLAFGGQAVTDDQVFVLVTNSYRAGGGGGFSVARQGQVIAESNETTRDILQRHLAEEKSLRVPQAMAGFRFAPVQDASAVFTTAPEARRYASQVASLGLQDLGDGPAGHALFRLSLANRDKTP